MSTTVSIIVPVYNTEKYLKRCVDSLLIQSYHDIEILLINDGSTDSSPIICDEYVSKDSRVRVFHTQNGGVSTARNRGIQEAKGEWILFVDSDDFVEPNYVCAFLKNNPDHNSLILQNFRTVNENGVYTSGIYNEDNSTKLTTAQGIVRYGLFLNGFICGKLYNRGILIKNGIKFPLNISYKEDMIFLLKYLLHTESIEYVNGCGYNYFTHTNSLSSSSHSPELLNSTLSAVKSEILKLLSPIDADSQLWRHYISFLKQCQLELFKTLYTGSYSYKYRRITLKQLKKIIQQSCYPDTYASDRFLKFLYKNNIWIIYDFAQRLLHHIRKNSR